MSTVKKCQISGEEFWVRDEDLEFYRKISPEIGGKIYEIPSPKLCPKERERRRLTYRNERNLYKIESALSGTSMISVFSPDTKFTIYTKDEFWGDKWDPLKYGRDFNFSHGFFEQFYELQLSVPRPPLINNKAHNSDYCNFADGNKNCYLVTSANRNEDSYFGFLVVGCKDTVDVVWCTDSELLYECLDCRHCYNLSFSQQCENCADSAFLHDCRGLTNCAFCVNLTNKRYHLFNKLCSKEEYEKFMREVSAEPLKYAEKFEEFRAQYPVRSNNFISCENVSGDNIFHSQNIYHGFDVYDSRDCAYLHDGLKGVDCHDICFFDGTELCYESTSLIGYGYRFTNFCRDSYNLFYCDNCHSCKNLFGCCGLRKGEYCVFNKQYSKSEYEELVPRIISRMTETGEYGEFFPSEYSLFKYEETLANDYFPIAG